MGQGPEIKSGSHRAQVAGTWDMEVDPRHTPPGDAAKLQILTQQVQKGPTRVHFCPSASPSDIVMLAPGAHGERQGSTDHLLPLMLVFGQAVESQGETAWTEKMVHRFPLCVVCMKSKSSDEFGAEFMWFQATWCDECLFMFSTGPFCGH